VTTLVVKLGATGDVVRTTPLLERLGGEVIWLTDPKNAVLLHHVRNGLRCFSWEERESAPDISYDLIINLEDTLEIGLYLNGLKCRQRFGAYADASGRLRYTEDSRCWFDLSLISSNGREEADRLKLLNRRTYQDLIFDGLGLRFAGEKYLLPEPIETGLSGDVAIAADAGPVWPMKRWAHYDEVKQRLEDRGLTVNVLPKRSSLLEHLADVRNHRCLVGGDSLPMHFALGTATQCVTLFTCTSPWEIYDYGVQMKIISPLLAEFFYKRGFNERATTAITVDEVVTAVLAQLDSSHRPFVPVRSSTAANKVTL
jgi:ADP-heptose:LPS heptosyltransferase